MLSKPGLILQHGDDGPPGRFAEWLRARDVSFTVHHAGVCELPDPRDFSFVCSLGSECSAADTDGWVPSEIAMLGDAVAAGVPVLGLCFGGQALSAALGGGIRVLEEPEVGWVPIVSDDETITPGPWLQYHYDLMLLPPGAHEVARSPAGTAAFRHGRHLALQFHPEVDPALVDRWARMDPKLASTGITPEQLARQSEQCSASARVQAFALFDRWLVSLS
jgi:GMP synthase-like glutamine amidotransferase